VHPYGAEENEIESKTELMDIRQIRKAVIEPANAWIRMSLLSFQTHAGGWLSGDHLIAERSQPSRISTGSCSHVQGDQIVTARDKFQ
jgi:hypothetical protein